MFKTKKILLILIFFGILGLARSSQAATYYVDYSSGNDSNDGLSASTAWKHVPGDSNATGNPSVKGSSSNPLSPGDTVLLKGGVVYHGSIIIDGRWVNGTEQNPITFKGDGWGSSKAIIDGSEALSGTWHQCASSVDCANNPNWQHIYYQDLTTSFTVTSFQQGFYEDGQFLWYSQDPNPADPFYYDLKSYFHTISYSQITRTSVTDPINLNQPDANYWNGAYVIAWTSPNATRIQAITGFNPSTNTISFNDLGGDTYGAGYSEYYAILNSLHVLDTAGEYYYDETAHRLYVWPLNSDDPSEHTFSVVKANKAIYANSIHDIDIEGFEVTGSTQGIVSINGGSGVIPQRVNISGNYIHHLKSNDWYSIYVSGTDMTVENNEVDTCQRSVGVLGGGSNVFVNNNRVNKASREGIWFMGTADSRITNNTVTNCAGTHANGISVYTGCSNITVSGNNVSNSNIAFTFDDSNNLDVFNNVFQGPSTDKAVANWGGMTGAVNFFNNTVLHGTAYFGATSETAVFNLKNNILDGGGRGNHTNNIYLALDWDQDQSHGWSLGTGESVMSDPTQIFQDYTGKNFHLKAGSPAIDAGAALSLFSADISGVSRPQGSAWDIGAYEYPSGVDTTLPAANTDSGGGSSHHHKKSSHHHKKKKKKSTNKISTISIPTVLTKGRGVKVWWSAVAKRGIGHYSYKWDGSVINTAVPYFFIPRNATSGTYSVTIKVYDKIGASRSKTIKIRVI